MTEEERPGEGLTIYDETPEVPIRDGTAFWWRGRGEGSGETGLLFLASFDPTERPTHYHMGEWHTPVWRQTWMGSDIDETPPPGTPIVCSVCDVVKPDPA